MSPRVDEDAAAALGAVCDRQSVNARRIALEVAGERIRRYCPLLLPVPVPPPQSANTFRQERGAIRESTLWRVEERVRSVGESHSFAQYRDSGAFIRAQQRRFLQLFRQVAVQSGVPTDSGFRWQAVHLRIVCGSFETEDIRVPAGGATSRPGVWRTVFSNSKQASHALAPARENVGGMRVGIDGDSRPHRRPVTGQAST